MRSKLLASYALLKELYDIKKRIDIYGIVSEYIKYVLYENKEKEVSLEKIKNDLFCTFSFDLPMSVIKSSVKRIDGTKIEKDICYFKSETIDDFHFKKIYDNSNITYNKLFEKLVKFVKQKRGDVDEEKLSIEFVSFFSDSNNNTGKYGESISQFVLSCENDQDALEYIKAIKEGNVLYFALSNNLSEIGSIKYDFTIYLDTEIIFNLAGYNGNIYQKTAEDLFSLIKKANAKGKKIRVIAFEMVKNEIDDFFNRAEKMFENYNAIIPAKVAMVAILKDCKTISDINDKKADLYELMTNKYGIVFERNKNYYDSVYDKYNMESHDSYDKENDEESIKFISTINKLRRGKNNYGFLESKFIFLTETYNTLHMSKNIATKLSCVGWAFSTDYLSNFLWCKLGYIFNNNDYPSSANVLYRARMVLANVLSSRVFTTYEETLQDYNDGKISDSQMASRVLSLGDKLIAPEEISLDEYVEFSNFDKNELDKYKKSYEENENSKKALISLNNEIISLKNTISNNNKELEVANSKIDNQEAIILESNDRYNKSVEIIKKYEYNERKRKSRRIIIITIIISICLMIFSCFISYLIFENYFTIISIIGSLCSIAAIPISIILSNKGKK